MVEEDSAEAQLCERALRQAGLDATLQVVRSAEEFRAALSSKPAIP